MSEQPIIVRKKIMAAHAHHGGSWKVAYADFVTAMMAFFLVMWLINLSQDDKDQIQGYFNDPLGMAQTQPRSKSIMTLEGMPKPKPGTEKSDQTGGYSNEEAELRSVEQKLVKTISQDKEFRNLMKGIRISVTQEGLLIEFMETQGAVFFESGSAVIRPEAKLLIDKISPILKQSGHPMEVQGHTDAQPFAGVTGNWGLSAARATSLQGALMSNGVDRFTQVSGFGATRLLDPQHPFASWNRRVTILLPRKYSPGQKTEAPGDALRSLITAGTQPQAVMVKPDPPLVAAPKP